MNDLTHEEQQRVRATLHHLRRQIGSWEALASVLHFKPDTVEKVANARGRNVTATMAFRVARLSGASIDDILAGRYRRGACPHCGHMPDLESDPTVADDAPSFESGEALRSSNRHL